MDSSATQGISTKVVTDFANQNENSIFASATSSVRDEITNNNLELAEQKKAEIGYNASSPIMTEANIAKYGLNLAYEMPLSYGNFSSSSSTSSSTSNSSSTDRYNENTCYITNNQTILSRIDAARFLDDFLNTKTINVRFLEDLGISNEVKSVEYINGFFDYKGISVSLISLNCSNKIESCRYVVRDFNNSPKYYIEHTGAESAAFDFAGHYKQHGTGLRISVKYSDRDKFSELFS